jgi:KDO2-lipid IV(A) lauroyltransferase
MYKIQRNPIMNRIMNRGRGRSFDHLFAKESVRSLIRELAANSVVWYAADQSHAQKSGKLIPFFGVPAMTNTAISRIARMSGATVLPYFSRRLPDDSGYRLKILPPLDDFPTDDEVRDTRRLVAVLEEFVRESPEQYWWIHQRFKGRPSSFGDVYATVPR